MTVPEQIPVTEQVANGATVKFFVQFQYANKNDLHVYVDGVEPSISEVYFDDNSFNFYAAPSAGKIIRIERITPKERDTDYDQSDNTFRPRVVNADFDKIWYSLQEAFNDLDEETKKRIEEDQVLKDYFDQTFIAFSNEINTRFESKWTEITDYLNATLPMFFCIMRKELALYEETGLITAIENILEQKNLSQLIDEYIASLDQDFVINTKKYSGAFGFDSGFIAAGGSYQIGNKLKLDNGLIVTSSINGNTTNPNLNMTGWDLPKASSIFDINGKSQQDINTFLTGLLVSPEFFTGTDSSKLQQALNTGQTIVIAKQYNINTQLDANVAKTNVVFTKDGKIKTSVNQNILNVRANKCKILAPNLEGFGSSSVQLAIGTGITLHGVKGCEVSYGNIVGAGGCSILLTPSIVDGIHYSCEDNVIAYNDIDCASTNLKSFDSAGIMLGYTNEVSGTYMHKNNHIYSNKVNGRDVVHHGIAMIGRGNGNKFDQNVIFDCREYGNVIYQSPYVDGTLFDNASTGNIITNIGHKDDNLCTKGMGIYLQKSDTTVVRDNIIRHVLLGTNNDTNLSRAGIAVGACVGSIVDSNIIEDSKQFGIQFAESFGCKATNNYIDGCLKDLVRITSSSAIDVFDNTMINGGEYGVYGSLFTRTTGRADHNGTSGDNINISRNIIKSTLSPIFIDSIDTNNKVKESNIVGNQVESPNISIYIKNAENTHISSNKCKSNTSLARIQVDTSEKLIVSLNEVYSSDAAQAGRIVLTNATNHNVSGNLFSPSNSNTPININGVAFRAEKKRYFSTTFPTSGAYDVGDIVWNSSPVAGSPIGWVCVNATGSGVWETFGTIGGLTTLTTTSLQAIGNAINTVGKYGGKTVFNQTNSKMYYAEGSLSASRWMQFDSGGAITPA